MAHLDPAQMDPYTSFGPYMAATVLIRHYARSETPTKDLEDIRLIVTAMLSLERHWKTTKTFLEQLRKDLEQYNIDIAIPQHRNTAPPNAARFSLDDDEDGTELSQLRTGPLLVGVLSDQRKR
ncbi:hypothetical protein LTS18_013586 [Coniosporium uncinatum]|uniref:Uncharacterized protein n=1 Tax=Coniosporium uncinatum TaxID=93489 RepID=A0ACC3DI99_9PEZI|nr:hypothetical protein LTS18_013586 [Coniosporium uncinatum]